MFGLYILNLEGPNIALVFSFKLCTNRMLYNLSFQDLLVSM